jgi:signal peptidase II
MRKFFSKGKIVCLIILAAIIIDQLIKIAVKTNMCLHESIRITDWFYILFIENKGMAYGMTFINKIVLSVFRIVAVSVLIVYITRLLKKKDIRLGYLICLALITAGAAGNIFDCLFYGVVFSESTPYAVSSFVGWGNGYAPLLLGKVVDMFYFPLIETDLPQWLPIWGGDHFIFFSPIFNFADSCISVGVVALLLFYRKELSQISFSSDKSEPDTGGNTSE